MSLEEKAAARPLIHRRTTCRACGSAQLDLVFALEPTPIGDAFLSPDRASEVQPSYPIDLFMCRGCGLAQLLDVIDPDVLYGDYIYVTSSSMGLAEHFQSYADQVIARTRLERGSLVVDLGSNDGTLLSRFKAAGMNPLGVEPATHIAKAATEKGIPTLGAYFTKDLAGEIVARQGGAKIVTANNVFANIDDLPSWVDAVSSLLAPDGVFVFESYYLADLVRNMVFDFIYHEHLTSFSVQPVKSLFERAGLELAAVERVATKGGSLRYFVQRPGGPVRPDGSVEELLKAENEMGLYDKSTYETFSARIDALKEQTRNFLQKAKSEGRTIAGFGASITGTTLIYHFEIGEYLDYLVDDNPAKQGRLSPGIHLPVYSSSVLATRKPDCVVILAWRFAQPFIANHPDYLASGGQFLIPVPEFKLVANG